MSNERIVGKIKSFLYCTDDDSLAFTIKLIDPKFKKKMLRDLSLAGKIKLSGDKIMYEGKYNTEEEDNADI